MTGNGIGRRLYSIVMRQKAFVAIIVMMGVMAFSGTQFYTAYNLLDMLNSTSILLILSFGVTLTIIAGGCDLSIGGILVVSGILSIKLQDVMPMEFAIAACHTLWRRGRLRERVPLRPPEDGALHHHPRHGPPSHRRRPAAHQRPSRCPRRIPPS